MKLETVTGPFKMFTIEEFQMESGKPKQKPAVRDDIPSQVEPEPQQEPTPAQAPKEASKQLFFPAALARAAVSLRLNKNS